MKFIGIDLAWTPRGGTGLCAVEGGRVVDSTRLSADAEILAWLNDHLAGDVLIAIDAPLIVRNANGRRPCDQVISRCFGAQHASTHSANLGVRAFSERVRGEWLARALELDIDPDFAPRTSIRRAIEVYPHPAIVAVFDLPVTLKYKAKTKRSVDTRSAALAELMRHLEGLVDAEPPLDVRSTPRWRELADVVSDPPSGAALSRVDDELDAFVCAYVGLYYWTHGTARCRVAGDLHTGYIVTPANERQRACLDARGDVSDAAPIPRPSGRSRPNK
jgi:predicted RNase H-like nuclease